MTCGQTRELFINIDGGSRGNPGPGASAYVIKDASGGKIAQGGRFFENCTNNQAEFAALKAALKRALELGALDVNVKSDSQLLVRQFLGVYKIKNPALSRVIADIKELAGKLHKITIAHIPREQNKEADALCNAIMDEHLKNKRPSADIIAY
jgi:ribonuclease HI